MVLIRLKMWQWFIAFSICAVSISGEFNRRQTPPKKKYTPNNYKMALTQQGYIQFLRYITEIPALKDFTFCIWLKSTNLTHAHPLLSYSHNEQDRFIRAWVSPHGQEINLAIRETVVLNVPVHLKEHQWYHICEAWSSLMGDASLFVNGKLLHTQRTPKVTGVVLPAKGDLVVGQEYTDFDKGLEDGIEGFIFGFNMVLESQYPRFPHQRFNSQRFPAVKNRRPAIPPADPLSFHFNEQSMAGMPFGGNTKINTNDNEFLGPNSLNLVPMNLLRRNHDLNFGNRYVQAVPRVNFIPIGRPYALRRYRRNVEKRRRDTGEVADSNSLVQDTAVNRTEVLRNIRDIDWDARSGKYVGNYHQAKILNQPHHGFVSLGLQLINLGFNKCVKDRGAPLSGPGVLISWTMTPVRVFGGAILKPASPVCGNF